jgi:hypothetical protein
MGYPRGVPGLIGLLSLIDLIFVIVIKGSVSTQKHLTAVGDICG